MPIDMASQGAVALVASGCLPGMSATRQGACGGMLDSMAATGPGGGGMAGSFLTQLTPPTPTPEAVADYLSHMRRCLQDPSALRHQARKHFGIYAQRMAPEQAQRSCMEELTIGMDQIMMSWDRLHLRLALPCNTPDTFTLLKDLADEHLGSPDTMRLNQEGFELFYLKMLQTLKPPLLVAGNIEVPCAASGEQERYSRRLQACRLDPCTLRAQAGKHFSIFGKGNEFVGISEVKQSMRQMYMRMNLLPNNSQVHMDLDRQASELLGSHAEGQTSRLNKDAWELFYWKVLSTIFGHLLPLERPGGADSLESTREPAEEPMPGAVGDQAADPSPTAKFGCGGATVPQALQGMAGMMPPIVPFAVPLAPHAAPLAGHGGVWPIMPPAPVMVPAAGAAGPPAAAVARSQAPLPSSLDNGRFVVERRLGSGSFGEVFKAKVAASGRLVAVKRVLKQRESVMKEYMILQGLSHPHVLQVIGHFEDEKSLYVVSEFLSGGSLTDLLQQQNVPFTEAWGALAIRQTLTAMAYCHNSGIVHNDLKPENLLLKSMAIRAGLHVVVSDFGQASSAYQPGQCPVTDLPLGDPRYTPPEAWEVQTCHGVCSKPGDVWMIACTLFEILSGGALPFLGRKNVSLQEFKSWCATAPGFAIEWVKCLKTGEPMWQNLTEPRSQSSRNCILMMLAKNPLQRPNCSQAMEHAWFWEQGCLQPSGSSTEAFTPEASQLDQRVGVMPGQLGGPSDQVAIAGDAGSSQGSSPSGVMALTPMGKKLPAAPVAKRKSGATGRGPKAPVPPATVLSGPLVPTKKGVQIKNQAIQHSPTTPESKKDDGSASPFLAGVAAGPTIAPGAKALFNAGAGAPAEEAGAPDGEAVGPPPQGEAQGKARGGSPPRAGHGRPNGHAAELAAQLEQEQGHPFCPSAGSASAPRGGRQTLQGASVDGAAQLDETGPPLEPSWLPRGVWRRYREPGTHRLWFFKEATSDSFFADTPGSWRQFADTDGRVWWWSQESNTSFWEDECDSAGEDDDGNAEEAEAWEDLEALGLQHLRQEVHLGLCLRDGAEVRSTVRYSGKPWEFHVVLFRSNSGDKLGLNFILDQDTRVPVVSQVKSLGMCADHNLEMQQFPEESPLHQMQVVPGDQVKVVNGFTTVDDIRKELTHALAVHLRVVRPGNPPEFAGTHGRVAGMLLQ